VRATLTDSDGNSKQFSITVAAQQAYLYLLLSGKVFVVPAVSAGVAQLESIVEFTTFVMSDEGDQIQSLESHLEKNEDCEFNLEEFNLSKVDDIIHGFSSFGVSINNSTAFPKGSNVRKVQVERALAHMISLQSNEVGILNNIAKTLKATQTQHITKLFVGEQKSYVSNRRDLDKQLFREFYSPDLNNALLNPMRRSVIVEKDKKMFWIEPVDVVLSVEMEDGEMKEVQLKTGSVKADLATFSRTKDNGSKYVDVKGVKLCTGRDEARKGNYEVFFDHRLEVNLANSNVANPLVNPDGMVYHAGFVSICLVNSKYEINIPVKEHLAISTPRAESVYAFCHLHFIVDEILRCLSLIAQ
jgi:hypothetical protein